VDEYTVSNLGRTPMTVISGSNIHSLNNEVRVGTRVTTSTSVGNAIHLENDNNALTHTGITIDGNIVEVGISITNTAAGLWRGVTISRNTISNVTGPGIYVLESDDVTIEGNNVFGSTTSGIQLQETSTGGSNTGRIRISNNYIENTTNEVILQTHVTADAGEKAGLTGKQI